MSKVRFKVFGCKRSGTNFIEHLLSKNFSNSKVFRNEFLWKHAPPQGQMDDKFGPSDKDIEVVKNETNELPEDDRRAWNNDEVYWVFVHKRIFTWYISYCNYAGKAYMDFDEEVVERWNVKNNLFLESYRNRKEKSFMFRFVDLLEEPKQQIGQLLIDIEDLRKSDDFFWNTDRKIKKDGEITDKKFDKSYYLNEEFYGDYTKELMNELTRHTDYEVRRKLGYT